MERETSEEVFVSTAELYSVEFSLFPLLWKQQDCRHLFFNALGDIVIRFFDTDLSLLIFFCVIEVKQKEVVTVTSVRYSCKTLKLLKLTISFTVNKDFNGSMLDEEIINGLRTKIYDRDRDWQVCTVGITGLRMKFKSRSRD